MLQGNSGGAQTIPPLTLLQQRCLWNSAQTHCLIGYIHLQFIGLALVSGAGLPTRHFNFRRWMPISVGTIRKGSKGLSPQGSAAFLTFAAAWLTAHRRLFYCFLSSSTHIHRRADKACVLRERLCARPHCRMRLLTCPTTQCNYFESLCQSCSEFSLIFLLPLLISTAVRELLSSTFTSAGCCLQAVFFPAPPVRWASGSIVPMGTASASVRISPTDLSGFPTPSTSPYMAIKTENRPHCASVCP